VLSHEGIAVLIMIRVEVIQDLSEFDKLEPAWTQLLSKSRSNSITLTWEWMRTWWTIYHDMRRLCLITVYDSGRLIGVAPMLSRCKPFLHYRLLPFRRIELLASGEESGHRVCSDYIDWIAEAGRESEVISNILDYLCNVLRGEWEELILPDISEDSPNIPPLRHETQRKNLEFEIMNREPCSIIRLPETWDAFLNNVSSGLRYKIRRGRRELEKLNGDYHVITHASELEEAINTLIELHQKRWTAKGESGAFASQKRTLFHQIFIPIALHQNWLRLGLLKVNGQPIGAIYNFQYNGRIYFYQSGILIPDDNHLRPGLLMHSFEVEWAIKAGYKEYDFLKRGHSDYKEAWATNRRNLLCIRIAKPGVKETALECAHLLYERMRVAKHHIFG
jgi:CelD/BcsL family acetyltransferase involved in cellulose biosynthesis